MRRTVAVSSADNLLKGRRLAERRRLPTDCRTNRSAPRATSSATALWAAPTDFSSSVRLTEKESQPRIAAGKSPTPARAAKILARKPIGAKTVEERISAPQESCRAEICALVGGLRRWWGDCPQDRY